MTANMKNVLCTKSHEYVIKEENLLKIGITDFAVEQLGDVVFVELPEVDSKFKKGEIFGTIESVKAASELYMPVGGTIVEVNEKVVDSPETVNNDCFGEGWFIKIADFHEKEIEEALPYEDYKAYLQEEENA